MMIQPLIRTRRLFRWGRGAQCRLVQEPSDDVKEIHKSIDMGVVIESAALTVAVMQIHTLSRMASSSELWNACDRSHVHGKMSIGADASRATPRTGARGVWSKHEEPRRRIGLGKATATAASTALQASVYTALRRRRWRPCSAPSTPVTSRGMRSRTMRSSR